MVKSVFGERYDYHLYRSTGFYDKAMYFLWKIDYSKGSTHENDLYWSAYKHYSKLANRENGICRSISTRKTRSLL